MAANVILPLLFPLNEQLNRNVTHMVGSKPIHFSHPQYNVTVREDRQPGPLLKLEATTLPPGLEVTYDLLGWDSHVWFAVDSNSGIISLISPLDFERNREHGLPIVARMTEGSAATSVLVIVQDVNEYKPRFTNSQYYTQITEEDDRHLPKVVIQVQATDRDGGKWGRLRYSIRGDGIPTNTTNSKLETKTSSRQRQSKTNKLKSFIKDDQKTPESRALKKNIDSYPATPTVVAPPSVSKSKYWRDKPTTFSIDEESGTIYVLKPLDRDLPDGKAKWHLTVTASDGEYEGTADVIVSVKDVNDNAPAFEKDRVNVSVPENAPAGSQVAFISATDYDDPQEGGNARLLYSLQKNVIDESSGLPIFSVNRSTGEIKTTLCCLDREHTAHYGLLLSVTDGGGLHGTCNIDVMISDSNDVPPEFVKKVFRVTVPETNSTDVVTTLEVSDPDLSNNMAFRVVPESGKNWQLVEVIPSKDDGLVKARVPLDYENPKHREGINFRVQVTDQGDMGWDNSPRYSEAEVEISLQDVNDNPPIFSQEKQKVEVLENAPLNSVIATLIASDIDTGLSGLITYKIAPTSDPGDQFIVNELGVITLRRSLDREESSLHLLEVRAMDRGETTHTATASITISVLDINDNPPRLVRPSIVEVDKLQKSKSFSLTITDPDDWSAGHGPPFTLTPDLGHSGQHGDLDLTDMLKLKILPGHVSTSGGITIPGEVTLLKGSKEPLIVPITISDKGEPRQSAVAFVTFLPRGVQLPQQSMPTKRKRLTVVTLGKPGPAIPIGRISPEGGPQTPPLSFSWRNKDMYLSVKKQTGQLTLSANTPPGKRQAKLFVTSNSSSTTEFDFALEIVRLSAGAAMTATPLDLKMDPTRLVIPSEESGSSPLDVLLQILNVEYSKELHRNNISQLNRRLIVVTIQKIFSEEGRYSRIWLIPSNYDRDYVSKQEQKLEILILKLREEIEAKLSTSVYGAGVSSVGGCSNGEPKCQCCCRDYLSLAEDWTVLDSETYAHTGPNIRIKSVCKCSQKDTIEGDEYNEEDELAGLTSAHAITSVRQPECSASDCLNGGKCVALGDGKQKCICPGNTFGPRCKLLARHFGSDKLGLKISPKTTDVPFTPVWLSPLPTCSKVHISIHILTESSSGLIFKVQSGQTNSRYILLEIFDGKPKLSLKKGHFSDEKSLILEKRINDFNWHRLDLIWVNEKLILKVDHCLDIGLDPLANSNTDGESLPPDICRGSISLPIKDGPLGWGYPVQLGSAPVRGSFNNPFDGCISHFKVNKNFYDMGSVADMEGSYAGCFAVSCFANRNFCPSNNFRCEGHPAEEHCKCSSDFSGATCQNNPDSESISFSPQSVLRMSLQFIPPEDRTRIDFSIRTRSSEGVLILLQSLHNQDWLTVELKSGTPCFSVGLNGQNHANLCIKQRIDDGEWHHVVAERHNELLEIWCDFGDADEYASEVILELTDHPFSVDRKKGLQLGGLMATDHQNKEKIRVMEDFHSGCLSKIRFFGHRISSLLLKRIRNNQMQTRKESSQTAFFSQNINSGCHSPSTCSNITCPVPLTCGNVWGVNNCGCYSGSKLARDSSSCTDIDECQSKPCLNDGICLNTDPGYYCSCSSAFTGHHCEWVSAQPVSGSYNNLAIGGAALSVASFLIVVITFLLWFNRRKPRDRKKENSLSRSASGSPHGNSPLQSFIQQNYLPNAMEVDDQLLGTQIQRKRKNSEKGELSLQHFEKLENKPHNIYNSGRISPSLEPANISVNPLLVGPSKEGINQLSVVGLNLLSIPPPECDSHYDMAKMSLDHGTIPPPSSNLFQDSNSSYGFDGGGDYHIAK